MTHKRWMKIVEKALPKMEAEGLYHRLGVQDGRVVWELTERGKRLIAKWS